MTSLSFSLGRLKSQGPTSLNWKPRRSPDTPPRKNLRAESQDLIMDNNQASQGDAQQKLGRMLILVSLRVSQNHPLPAGLAAGR